MSDLEATAREAIGRAERATGEQWWGQFVNPQNAIIWAHGLEGAGAICRLDRESKYHRSRGNINADVDFIARARDDVPKLATGVLELLEENRKLEQKQQQEFDIASGYHRQVVRLKEENRQLLEERDRLQGALQEIRDLTQPQSGEWNGVHNIAEKSLREYLAPKGEG